MSTGGEGLAWPPSQSPELEHWFAQLVGLLIPLLNDTDSFYLTSTSITSGTHVVDWTQGSRQGLEHTGAGDISIDLDNTASLRTYYLWVYNNSGATRSYTLSGVDYGDTSLSIQNGRMTIIRVQAGIDADGSTRRVYCSKQLDDVIA